MREDESGPPSFYNPVAVPKELLQDLKCTFNTPFYSDVGATTKQSVQAPLFRGVASSAAETMENSMPEWP